ncbi:hypothetical protein JHK86_019410 [Glycine max]|nr:hypothetical protein JHK86_019410 [Glycine max]
MVMSFKGKRWKEGIASQIYNGKFDFVGMLRYLSASGWCPLKLLEDLIILSHTEVNQEIEPDKNHEQQAETHSDHSFPTDRESSNFLIMDGTFELNVQEHRLQEYLQSNYSLPSDNESSDG